VVSPTFAAGPTADQVAAIACPYRRAALITQLARRCGTLPSVLAALRRAALVEAREQGSAGKVAIRVGISRARVIQLTRTAGQESTP
jgi:hypothetical protein